KVFHVRDGQGIVKWHEAGFRSGIISGRNSTIVDVRAGELGIEFVRQGIKNKVAALNEVIQIAGISADEAAFVGDDLSDISAIRQAGLGIAVADAADEVKLAAHYVTGKKGGEGAIREVIDFLLS